MNLLKSFKQQFLIFQIFFIGVCVSSVASADYFNYRSDSSMLYRNGNLLFGKNDGPAEKFYVKLIRILDEAYQSEPVAASRYLDIVDNGIRSILAKDKQEAALFIGMLGQLFTDRERKTDISSRFNDQLRSLDAEAVMLAIFMSPTRQLVNRIFQQARQLYKLNSNGSLGSCAYQIAMAAQDLDVQLAQAREADSRSYRAIRNFNSDTSSAFSCLQQDYQDYGSSGVGALVTDLGQLRSQ